MEHWLALTDHLVGIRDTDLDTPSHSAAHETDAVLVDDEHVRRPRRPLVYGQSATLRGLETDGETRLLAEAIRRYRDDPWPDSRIEAELERVFGERLPRDAWPTERAFREAGADELVDAMKASGGLRRWAVRMGFEPPPVSAAPDPPLGAARADNRRVGDHAATDASAADSRSDERLGTGEPVSPRVDGRAHRGGAPTVPCEPRPLAGRRRADSCRPRPRLPRGRAPRRHRGMEAAPRFRSRWQPPKRRLLTTHVQPAGHRAPQRALRARCQVPAPAFAPVTPARRLEQTNIRTPLAAWRVKRGMTQRELYQAAGLSRSVYNKLERGDYPDPPLRWLSNCAIVLGVDLAELIQPEWREWWKPADGYPDPPEDPSRLWRQ